MDELFVVSERGICFRIVAKVVKRGHSTYSEIST